MLPSVHTINLQSFSGKYHVFWEQQKKTNSMEFRRITNRTIHVTDLQFSLFLLRIKYKVFFK
jgi:hypothetical protein